MFIEIIYHSYALSETLAGTRLVIGNRQLNLFNIMRYEKNKAYNSIQIVGK